MTAEVGVLNKSCVVLAADSAVTISSKDKSKVFNRANKVFSLNDKDPIGIMVFNNAEYMGVPVETIIKLYRKENRDSLPTVTDHVANFLAWLKNNSALFPDELQENFLISEIANFFYEKMYTPYLKEKDKKSLNKTQSKNFFYDLIDQTHLSMSKKDNSDAFDLSDEKFIQNKYELLFQELLKQQEINFSLSKPYFNKLKAILTFVITKGWYDNGYTGFVFAGFGESEHFPSLYAIRSSGIFNKKINYTLLDNIHINHDKISDLKVYAQSDMADTFINGAHPAMLNFFLYRNRFFNYTLQRFANTLPPPYAEGLKELSGKITDRFEKDLTKFIDDNHRQHIYGMLDLMPKEELVEFAESLINITHMKQLVSTEQETVGGPVDIAVISKGDGFVWVKRKHYFPSEINAKYIAGLYN